jgi:hypothetical protein
MKGLDIFLHSLRQVLGNLPNAIKISAVPFGIQFVATFLLTRPDRTMAMMNDPMAMMQGGPSFVAQLANLVIMIVTSVWMAIAWHRFVLKNEVPTGFVPPFDGNRIGAYFVRSLLIGIVLIVAGFVLSIVAGFFVIGLISSSGGGMGTIFTITVISMLLIYFPLFVIGYRLSTSLPGTAIDNAGTFMSGWEATAGETGTFIGLGLISVVAMVVSAILTIFVLSKVTVLFIAWTLVFNWLAVLVGLSVLTTLYGHYIEKRPLV